MQISRLASFMKPSSLLTNQIVRPSVKSFAATTISTPVEDVKTEPRFLEQVELFFNRAAAKTNVPEHYLDLIRTCDTIIRFNIPIQRDNGTLENVTCYRA